MDDALKLKIAEIIDRFGLACYELGKETILQPGLVLRADESPHNEVRKELWPLLEAACK